MHLVQEGSENLFRHYGIELASYV